jgi:hypothetical protein
MRLSVLDRLKAISRCPEYINDFKIFLRKYSQSEYSDDIVETEIRIRRKWKLKDQLIEPYFDSNLSESKIDETVIESNKREPIVELTEWPPNVLYIMYAPQMEKYKYFRCRVDLNQTESILLKAFQKKIKEWQKDIPKGKNKKTAYDPWYIYDLHVKGNMSLLEITRKLEGKEYPRGMRTPEYNEDLKKPYMRVTHSFEKAKKMIQEVSTFKL